MRVLGVDPGDKRIGLSVSDPTATIANPLSVINHVSRVIDAATIVSIARDQNVELIVVGQALDENNEVGPAARKALRMAEAIRSQCSISVVLWDESGSTHDAKQAGIALDVSRHKRQGHLDHIAATIILQSYLDAQDHLS